MAPLAAPETNEVTDTECAGDEEWPCDHRTERTHSSGADPVAAEAGYPENAHQRRQCEISYRPRDPRQVGCPAAEDSSFHTLGHGNLPGAHALRNSIADSRFAALSTTIRFTHWRQSKFSMAACTRSRATNIIADSRAMSSAGHQVGVGQHQHCSGIPDPRRTCDRSASRQVRQT